MANADALAKGEYVIGIAIIIAALILSAAVWTGLDRVQKGIGLISLTVPAAAVVQAGNQQPAAAQQQQAQQGDWSFEAADPSIGPKDAKVTVTEFADFQCPYCAVAYGKSLGGTQLDSIRGSATKIANEYAKTGKIRFVYHIMSFLGQESVDAANAALCAREIGGDDAFFKMHDKLFDSQGSENSGTFSKANLKKIAADAGFSSAQMTACIDSGKYDSQVTRSNSEAGSVGVQGTPTFAINNQMASPEYTQLKSSIDGLLGQ